MFILPAVNTPARHNKPIDAQTSRELVGLESIYLTN